MSNEEYTSQTTTLTLLEVILSQNSTPLHSSIPTQLTSIHRLIIANSRQFAPIQLRRAAGKEDATTSRTSTPTQINTIITHAHSTDQ